jgi:hypothetical protein
MRIGRHALDATTLWTGCCAHGSVTRLRGDDIEPKAGPRIGQQEKGCQAPNSLM